MGDGIPDVMVLEKCSLTLYSTRVMHALFGFKHAFEAGVISVPGAHDIAIRYGNPFAVGVQVAAIPVRPQAGRSGMGRPLLLLPHLVGHGAVDD